MKSLFQNIGKAAVHSSQKGWCEKQKRYRAFSMERDKCNKFSFDETLKDNNDFEIFGTGSEVAEKLLQNESMSEMEALRILKAVIQDPNVDSVGGNIQYGCFNGKNFQPYGVAKFDNSVKYCRGPLDFNGPDFDQETGLISNFPLLDLIP